MHTPASTSANRADSRSNATELDIAPSVTSDFEKAKVLLVDDSRLIRMGLRRSLVEIGLTDITEAGDGREAIETLVREHFDLMLLDMEMPEMNGMEVLAVLRDTPHHPWPPVIVISGGTSLDDAVRCIELGAEDYLSKPFNPVLLRARVKTSVERKRLRDQEALRMRQLKRQHEALASEQAKTEQLLLNILPRKIAQRLKAGEEHIADAFPNVSVLFADMVGFTAMSRTMTASALVEVLGDLFSRFDLITEKHGLEKIKTIGDCYMLAGGVPEPSDDHAHAVIDAALEFCTALEDMRERTGGALRMRIGVHSGPIVAGVIGLRKFTYDLWGDTVNVASRMESTGEPGRIHVSVNTANLIRHDFKLESRGSIEVKSLGQVETFFVNGRN
ncbi:adenylate/guanylate cyclase domain-containing protein [Limnohabitans sp. yimb22184]|uniref:adenylate/guanylate cyclase domain-containing protein n=1 Tax=Limnohabitans sp. YIMB22184 TaxID=3374104 RepID=UPI003A87BB65